jgi:hypothetical protein
MLGFLANLGSGALGLGKAFGRGAVSIGKDVGKGFKRLGEMGGDLPESPDMFRTPGFNPNAGRGVRGVEDAVAAAESDARADFGSPLLEMRNLPVSGADLPDLPIRRGDLPIPPPKPAPTLAELRSPLLVPPVAKPPLPLLTGAPGGAPSMVGPRTEADFDRRNLPIPGLPGHSGGPIPYNSIDAAKYDSVMSHVKRDAEGNLAGGFNRDWKTSLRNALLGASAAARGGDLGAALGGAIAAGAGSMINPQAGYEFNFDMGERPKMEAEIMRGRQEQERERADRMAALDEALKGAQVNEIPRKAESERVKLELERRKADQEGALNNARVALLNAQTEAARTGVPKEVDIENPETGQIETVMVYPNGKREVVGLSSKAAINRANIKSREKIARENEAGADRRNVATNASAKERTQMNIDDRRAARAEEGGDSELKKASSGRKVEADELQRYASSRKLTKDAARQKLKDMGYTVD